MLREIYFVKYTSLRSVKLPECRRQEYDNFELTKKNDFTKYVHFCLNGPEIIPLRIFFLSAVFNVE